MQSQKRKEGDGQARGHSSWHFQHCLLCAFILKPHQVSFQHSRISLCSHSFYVRWSADGSPVNDMVDGDLRHMQLLFFSMTVVLLVTDETTVVHTVGVSSLFLEKATSLLTLVFLIHQEKLVCFKKGFIKANVRRVDSLIFTVWTCERSHFTAHQLVAAAELAVACGMLRLSDNKCVHQNMCRAELYIHILILLWVY